MLRDLQDLLRRQRKHSLPKRISSVLRCPKHLLDLSCLSHPVRLRQYIQGTPTYQVSLVPLASLPSRLAQEIDAVCRRQWRVVIYHGVHHMIQNPKCGIMLPTARPSSPQRVTIPNTLSRPTPRQ
jgi:hypothetical protein